MLNEDEAVVALADFWKPIVKRSLKQGSSWRECIEFISEAMETKAVETTRHLPRDLRKSKLRALRTKIHPRVIDALSACTKRPNPEAN